MINKITVQSFFSFGKHQTIELNDDTNILVGINGSGKSNFIKIIQFLYEGIAGKEGLRNLINKKWGGFSSMIYCGGDEDAREVIITYHFDRNKVKNVFEGNGFLFPKDPIYEVRISKVGLFNYDVSEKMYNESRRQGQPPFIYLDVSNGKGIISRKDDTKIGIKQAIFDENELVLKQISEPENFYPLFTLKKAIEEIVVYSYFDTTLDSKIRQLSPYYSELKLLPSGENLTHLLSYLNGNYTKSYDQILLLLKKVNPHFKELVFNQPTSSKTLLALKEQHLNKAITVDQISDGTLRFLILLSILYNPNRGMLICLDEPETGLHPDMIQTIGEGIKAASKDGTQMIIATHSPLLLNGFELEDLKIFEKDKDNQTIISRKTEDDFKEWEGEFLVGQMWLRGELGGVRW